MLREPNQININTADFRSIEYTWATGETTRDGAEHIELRCYHKAGRHYWSVLGVTYIRPSGGSTTPMGFNDVYPPKEPAARFNRKAFEAYAQRIARDLETIVANEPDPKRRERGESFLAKIRLP
jgi:hypothetical protein